MPTPYTIPALRLTIRLDDQPFATGGEGALFRIQSPADWRGHVVKILHPRKRTAARAEKAHYLLAHPPTPPVGDATIVWLQHVVCDSGGAFAGYLMPYVEGQQLELLTTPQLPKRWAEKWKGWAHGDPAARSKRLAVGYHLAAAVHALHATQRYILVDLKPDNVLVQPSGALALVDVDSIAVSDGERVLFKASVATPEYTPPEYLGGPVTTAPDATWDRFSLAVMLYRLLVGVHPFAASAQPPYDQLTTLGDKIQAGLFVHAPAANVGFEAVPPFHERFAALLPAVQALFIRAFQAGHRDPTARPTAEEWAVVLAEHHARCAAHPLPSNALPPLNTTTDWWYQRAVHHLVEEHRQAQAPPEWEDLPSAAVWKRTRQHYTAVGHFVKQRKTAILTVLGLALALVLFIATYRFVNQAQDGTPFETFAESQSYVFREWGGNGFRMDLLLLLALLPLLLAVVQEGGVSVRAWRQKVGWNRLREQALGSHSLKRLRKWHERLFRQRSTLRQRLRQLQKERAVYRNVKQERERLLHAQYQPQLREAHAQLDDHLRVLEAALHTYDQQAEALRHAEQQALSTLRRPRVEQLNFPRLFQDSDEARAIKTHYAQRQATLLAEAEATYRLHQQVLERAFQDWSARVRLPERLLDADYCRVLHKLDELDHSVDQQQRTLIELDGRLQKLRTALRRS